MFDIKDTDIHEVYALSYEPTVSYNKSFLRKITKFFGLHIKWVLY